MMSKAAERQWGYIAIVFVAVCAAYCKIVYAPFSVWDDKTYILRNGSITGMGWSNISAWFSSYYVGNYQPLTIFSYAIDYAIGGYHPAVYHCSNILIHALNSVLVYLLISKVQQHKLIALLAALVFGLHPVQTENVSWIAERKTLLYSFFYLLAVLQYTGYIVTLQKRKLITVVLYGIAAMLCKGTAVALPGALLAVHIWMNKGINRWQWVSIIVLCAAGIITGLTAISAQDAGQFLNHNTQFGWWDTLILAVYAYVQYIINLLMPVRLCVMYPYPASVGPVQYMYAVVAAAILAIGIIAWHRNWRILCGGILFYTVNIALLLQFVQFGDYLMADRYMYMACIGIILPAVYYPLTAVLRAGKHYVVLLAGAALSVTLLVATVVRNEIWMSDINFFNSIQASFPQSAVAAYSVGALYLNAGNYAEAEKYINKAVALDARNYMAWYNKGVLHLKKGETNQALEGFNKCLTLHHHPDAYLARALIYMSKDRYQECMADANTLLRQQPKHAKAWYIKGYCMEQMADMAQAVSCYDNAIKYDNSEADFYLGRGRAYGSLRQNELAMQDLNRALAMAPNSGEAMYYRGAIKYNTGGNPCDDFKMAISMGYKVPLTIVQQFCK